MVMRAAKVQGWNQRTSAEKLPAHFVASSSGGGDGAVITWILRSGNRKVPLENFSALSHEDAAVAAYDNNESVLNVRQSPSICSFWLARLLQKWQQCKKWGTGGEDGGAQMAAGSGSAAANKMAAPLPFHLSVGPFAGIAFWSFLRRHWTIRFVFCKSCRRLCIGDNPEMGGSPNFVLGWRRLGHRRLVYGT